MNTNNLIKIRERRIYLTTSLSFSLLQTNFPTTITFAQRDVYYEIEIISFDAASKILKLTVNNYNPVDTYRFEHQIFDYKPIRLEFSNLIKDYITRDLMIYNNSLWRIDGLFIPEPEELRTEPLNYATYKKQFIPFKYEITIREENYTWDIKYKDCLFESGFVSFLHKLPDQKEPTKFKIENKHIIPQFDHIKNYFPKALGSKKHFTVQVIVTLTDFQVTDTKAKSQEIDRIDETLIDKMRTDSVNRLISRASNQNSNKALFTADEIFEEGNIFQQTEINIIEILSGKRNRKQLEYLSGHKHSTKQKIRFTLKPHFGFLFFIEGKEKYHFCWELLDSHATYLWSFKKSEKEPNRLYEEVENEIVAIHEAGRENYLKVIEENLPDYDFIFNRVPHREINSAKEAGFIVWKQKLDNHID